MLTMALSRISRNFFTFFSKHQGIKSALIAGGLMSTGDMISQLAIEKTEKYNYIRTARFGLIGFAFIGPVLHKWYGVIERISFKSPAGTALSRMAVDQLMFAPIVLFAFIGVNGGLQGFPPKSIYEQIRRDYGDIMIANYKLWPATQTINFWIIPLAHRVLFAQTVALFWNVYLAWKLNQEESNIAELQALSPNLYP